MADAKKTCGKCNEVITTGKVLTALEKSWHPEHFVCLTCEKPITESTFHEKEGQPICTVCYDKNYTNHCAKCMLKIKGSVVKAVNKTWHDKCFLCSGPCKKPLAGTSFFEKEGKCYCKEDYEKIFSPKCKGCSKSITEGVIIALDAKWHKECFKCKKCKNPIVESSFAVEDSKPLCSECAK